MGWFSRRTKVAAAQVAVKYAGVMVGMGQARWLNRSYRILAREGFETNPVVYACVTKLAKAIASVDLHLYDHTRQGKLRKIDRHDILDLINSPNPMWSGRQFREKMAMHFLIGGNTYILGNNGPDRAPTELWLPHPDCTSVDTTGGRMLPAGYKYKAGGQEIFYPVNQVTGRSTILHLKTVNPLDEWYGMPPMAAASYGIDVFNAGQEWNKALLQNEGRPSGVLKVQPNKDGSGGMLTDDQFDRVKSMIDDQFTGSANAGRPMLLEGGMDWQQLSMTSKDMDHRETMLTNARFIAACYGTPPQLVNIPGESTFSNYGQATLSYWGDTVLPLLGLLLEDINRWLPAMFGEPRCFLWYDEEQIPALEPRRAEKSTRINAAEYMTIDEKREAMGMEAYVAPEKPGANSLFVDAKKIPIELAGKVDPNLHPALAEDAPAAIDPKKAGGWAREDVELNNHGNGMKIKHKSFAIHDFKMDDESRTVEGWASTFGGIDSYGDTIAPGAFAESIKVRTPKMLWQHDSRQVIGVWESAVETKEGLYVKGRILDTTLGDDAYKLAKAGAIDSMSIGYGVKDSAYDPKTGIRTLKKIDLWEVSLVTFPANADATITQVKAAMEDIDEAADLLGQAAGMCDAYASGQMEATAEAFATVSQMVRQAQSLLEEPDGDDEGKSRDFTPKNIERILREAGMSRADARGVLAKGFNAIATPREAGQQEHDRLVKFINSLNS